MNIDRFYTGVQHDFHIIWCSCRLTVIDTTCYQSIRWLNSTKRTCNGGWKDIYIAKLYQDYVWIMTIKVEMFVELKSGFLLTYDHCSPTFVRRAQDHVA
jgi:hypothetical protein